jgi:hypothetical protein
MKASAHHALSDALSRAAAVCDHGPTCAWLLLMAAAESPIHDPSRGRAVGAGGSSATPARTAIMPDGPPPLPRRPRRAVRPT